MILRCTAKILTLLATRPAELATLPAFDDDWYLNLLWIDRRKCLLLTHAGTLFPVFVADVRKADIIPIGPYIVSLIEEHLSSEGLASDVLGRLEPDDVHLAKTASRSILGVMSSSTGTRRVPQPISTVSMNGSTRRLNVEVLIPSASAAWRRVYASLSTRAASRTTTRGSSAPGRGSA